MSCLFWQCRRYMWWLCRLIVHTKDMMTASRQHEKLCITILQTLKEMVSVDVEFGPKVRVAACCPQCMVNVGKSCI